MISLFQTLTKVELADNAGAINRGQGWMVIGQKTLEQCPNHQVIFRSINHRAVAAAREAKNSKR